jgi:hypothetical protein
MRSNALYGVTILIIRGTNMLEIVTTDIEVGVVTHNVFEWTTQIGRHRSRIRRNHTRLLRRR